MYTINLSSSTVQKQPRQAFLFFRRKRMVFNITYPRCLTEHIVKFDVCRVGRSRHRVFSLTDVFAQLTTHMQLQEGDCIA